MVQMWRCSAACDSREATFTDLGTRARWLGRAKEYQDMAFAVKLLCSEFCFHCLRLVF